MYHRSSRLHWVAAARLGGVCGLWWSLLTPALADPLIYQDDSQQTETSTATSRLLTPELTDLPTDTAPTWPAATSAAPAKPDAAKPSERSVPSMAAGLPAPVRAGASAAMAAQGAPQPGADAAIRSAIKESVRPVYDELVESGAVDALRELKADLGLNKNQWSDQEKAEGAEKGPGQWNTPGSQEPAAPPRTAAQAQLDREMATMMREKLVDQITPWVIGLVALYAAGYLGKLLYGYVRWRTAKRTQRRIARAQRHGSRHSHGSAHAANHPSSAPGATNQSQESV